MGLWEDQVRREVILVLPRDGAAGIGRRCRRVGIVAPYKTELFYRASSPSRRISTEAFVQSFTPMLAVQQSLLSTLTTGEAAGDEAVDDRLHAKGLNHGRKLKMFFGLKNLSGPRSSMSATSVPLSPPVQRQVPGKEFKDNSVLAQSAASAKRLFGPRMRNSCAAMSNTELCGEGEH